jgi:hypothetical protein
MRRLACLAVVAACKFVPNELGDGGTVGAEKIDAPLDAADPKCFGEGTFYFCFTAVPTGAVDGNGLGNTFSTDTDCDTAHFAEVVVVGNVQACAIRGDTITLMDAMIRFVGTRPLVIAAAATIDIKGSTLLDASGGGPASDPSSCAAPDGTAGGLGGGGGAGGSFAALGGNGGGGQEGAAGTADGKVSPIDTLRGGCHGGASAGGDNSPQAGGAGGGAILLVAHTSIHVDADITVSGLHGPGGSASRNSGAGGGSGGLVVFHTQQLMLGGGAHVSANGGGGGGGGGNVGSGSDGADPNPMMPDTIAQGGQSTGGGAVKGGNGAGGTTQATPGVTSTGGGGGGGGGGFGAIRILAGADPGSAPGGAFSPDPTN